MSKKTRLNSGKLIILALVLLVPGFLYVAVSKLGSNHYVRLPVFGHKELSGEMKRNWGRTYPDTIFHLVGPLEFAGMDDKQMHFMDSDTLISVVHLFYTRDQAFSPLMLSHVNDLAQTFQNVSFVQFYSLSVDSTDTQKKVSALVSDFPSYQQENWHFGLHAGNSIFDYAKEQLLIDAMPDPSDSSHFLISNQLVLIDGTHRIRGFYDISVKGEVDRLKDEIKLLMVEELRKRPVKLELQDQ